MKKYFVTLIVINTFAFSLAQSITNVVPDQTSCVNIIYNLNAGSKDINTGGNVTILQKFLLQNNYLKSNPTGFFGVATKKAVQSFQSANKIMAQGNVGPFTKLKIKEISCGSLNNKNVISTTTKIISTTGDGIPHIDKFGCDSENINCIIYGINFHQTLNEVSINNITKIFPSSDGNSINFRITDFGNPQKGSYIIKVKHPTKGTSNNFIFNIDSVYPKLIATVTVLSPNGGENFKLNGEYSIKLNIPTDQKYSIIYYLLPENVNASSSLNPKFDSNVGGYLAGKYTTEKNISPLVIKDVILADIPIGNYKIKTYLNNEGNFSTKIPLSYDEGDIFFNISSSTLVKFSKNLDFVNQVVAPNTKNIKIGSFTVSSSSTDDVHIKSINIFPEVSGYPITNIKNLFIKDGQTVLGTPVNNLGYWKETFSFPEITILSNTTKTFDVYADIGGEMIGDVLVNMGITYDENVSGVKSMMDLNDGGVKTTTVQVENKDIVTVVSSDDNIFVANDTTGKKWTVNYKDAKYYETWISNNQESSRTSDFGVWLKLQKDNYAFNYNNLGVSVNMKITGAVDEFGVFHASKIEKRI